MHSMEARRVAVWQSAIVFLMMQLSLAAQTAPVVPRSDASERAETPKKHETLRLLLRKNPDSMSIAIELARQLARSDETMTEAIESLETLAQKDDLTNNQNAVVLYELAFCCERLRRNESAEKYLTRLAELSYSHALKFKAILRLADMHCDKRQDQFAANYLSRISRAELSSQEYPAYALLLARNSIDCGQAHKASDVLQTLDCYELTPDQRTSLEFLRIQAAMELRDYEQAESSLNALSELAQSESDLPDWAVTIALRRIELALARKQHQLAADLARAALLEFPSFDKKHEFLLLLSRAEIADIQFASARDHLQAVIDSPLAAGTESAAKAQWMIGETFFLQQRFAQAIQAYQQVLEAHPHPLWKSTAALQQAKCYEQLGKITEATKMYEATKAEYSGSHAAEQAAARLSELSRLRFDRR